jgi:nucleoside-diphosphate-sugar epimerase
MRYLFVGGTGVISSACAALVTSRGHELTLVTRGRSHTAPPPPGAHVITADARDARAFRTILSSLAGGVRYDAVVQFVGYEPGHVADDVITFAPRADHYVLVSTTATYKNPTRLAPLAEDAEQENPHWEYARKKIEAERVLREYAADANLSFTIARLAYTYGPTRIPGYVGNSRLPWTIVDRMRRGADIIIPGDGSTYWSLTHARDVATGIVGLLGNEDAFGEAVNIVGDEALTWDAIYETIAVAAGLTRAQFAAISLHVPSDAIVTAFPDQTGHVYGDKIHTVTYDTSTIRRLVPEFATTTLFDQGVRESIAWYEANPERQKVDVEADALFDDLAYVYRRALRDSEPSS